jgi:osmotically-inducible protein OsmY
MITSAISSAARLTLAPAKLARQMAGALLRGLRGDTSRHTSSARRSAGTTPARRSRAQAQTKRATTRSSSRRQPKRTAARARPKSQPSRASQPSPSRPKRADRTEPQGDMAITREVESTIFRDLEAERGQVDVNVSEGVVRLRGEVGTPDLIRELEARAARVPQVRRVENLLHTPAPPAPPAPVRPTNLAGVAQGAEAAPAETAGDARAPRTGRWGDKAESPSRPAGDESADHDELGGAEPDRDATSS